ncbi:MAG TPA: hypothetical protein VE486_07195 [Candidatus Baltobacteraceae bacterium]|jgi:hypothetical protein|nr:hypothetical protein [Candidatus Baltobacteraceae bacterium]
MDDRIFSNFFVPELGRSRAIARRYGNVPGIWLVILAAFAVQGCNRSDEEQRARRMASRVELESVIRMNNLNNYPD